MRDGKGTAPGMRIAHERLSALLDRVDADGGGAHPDARLAGRVAAQAEAFRSASLAWADPGTLRPPPMGALLGRTLGSVARCQAGLVALTGAALVDVGPDPIRAVWWAWPPAGDGACLWGLVSHLDWWAVTCGERPSGGAASVLGMRAQPARTVLDKTIAARVKWVAAGWAHPETGRDVRRRGR